MTYDQRFDRARQAALEAASGGGSGTVGVGDRVRSRTNGETGYVTGVRESARLGFRYVVSWDEDRGYSLVPLHDLVRLSPAAEEPQRRRSVG